MKKLQPHFKMLPLSQRSIWPELKTIKDMGFVLYGGTAIALRLGHRISVDFDFFTDAPLQKEELLSLPLLSKINILQDEKNTLTVQISDETDPLKISFFGGISTGRITPPDITEDNVLYVASEKDLLAHKLKLIIQRPLAKDYMDIAFLLRAGNDLAQGLAVARKMWPGFQPAISLKALTFFEDGDLDTLPQSYKRQLIREASSVGDLPEVELESQSLASGL